MGLGPSWTKRLPLQALWRTGICFVLIGVVVFALHLISGMTQGPETYVEMSRKPPANAQRADSAVPSPDRLRFAIATMVSAEETFSTYRQFVERISRDVGRKGAFVLRPSNEQVRRKLEWGEVDVALVCTGTYLRALQSGSIRLLAQPELEEGASFRSLLVVPADSRVRGWEDLQDGVMAFTDHESFTGFVLPSATLMDLGHVPDTFFKKIVYTSSHDRSILAVSRNVIDAAAVDSLVWQSNLRQIPLLKSRVKVIWQSEDYGPPPIVVPKSLDRDLERALQKALLSLHEDEGGRSILSAIGIKRFVPPKPDAYATAIDLYKKCQHRKGTL